MTADEEAWIASVRRTIDGAKMAITSNARLDDGELADMASRLESIFKECRAMVVPE